MSRIEISPDIYLDRISTKDTSRLQEIANNPVLRKNMGDTFPYPYTMKDAERFVNNCDEEFKKEFGERNYWIYIDWIYAWNLWWHQKKKWRELYNVHLGYWLWKEYRWKWIMTKIMSKVLYAIDKEIPARHRIYANVVASNPWSRRVLEKNWFILEWTAREAHRYDNAWYDNWTLSLLKSEFDGLA